MPAIGGWRTSTGGAMVSRARVALSVVVPSVVVLEIMVRASEQLTSKSSTKRAVSGKWSRFKAHRGTSRWTAARVDDR
ncbi:MAG TPA: hypothetical protein VGU22_17355 [Methylomirabilota bacterium]|nr:hypothetical protein [Methylomirabilota bacterium]